jgi:hypothetical protein
MLLSYQDIENLTRLGYDRTFFVEERNGWLQLKNLQGLCVFQTGGSCRIYKDRPKGCTLYPVVYDNDDHRAILDQECPQKHWFSLGKNKIRTLNALVATLRRERDQRKKTPR